MVITDVYNEAIASNVFLDKHSAQSFENATKIDVKDFHRMADYIVGTLDLYHSNNIVNILDIGTGTGRTILNILDRLYQKNIDFHATCFDISEHMLNKFKEALSERNAITNFVDWLKHNADIGLDGFKKYDIVFIVSMLQYLRNWREFLDELIEHIAANGHLILAELIGWYRLLDGSFDSIPESTDQLYFDFWKEYFLRREKYGTWRPEIKFSNIAPALSFLEKDRRLFLLKQQEFLWPNTIRWRDVLSWVQDGSVSSLGSNMPDGSRQILKKKMYDFLRQREICINTSFSIEWGFRLYFLRKDDD